MWCKYIFFKYSIQFVFIKGKVYLVFWVIQAAVTCTWYQWYEQYSNNAYSLKCTVYREVQLSILGAVKK